MPTLVGPESKSGVLHSEIGRRPFCDVARYYLAAIGCPLKSVCKYQVRTCIEAAQVRIVSQVHHCTVRSGERGAISRPAFLIGPGRVGPGPLKCTVACRCTASRCRVSFPKSMTQLAAVSLHRPGKAPPKAFHPRNMRRFAPHHNRQKCLLTCRVSGCERSRLPGPAPSASR